MAKLTPIFLLSLPRSGSTLVQRVLAADKDIITTAEPWFLLPHLSSLGSDGVRADYNSEVSRVAIGEFIQLLPNKKEDYISALRCFAEDVYGRFSKNSERYFLDKTPRYSLISECLYEVFPDAKYIYLWRNPLSIIASSVMSWGKPGLWNVHGIHVDLFIGLPRLLSSYDAHKNQAIAFQYEGLVSNQSEWEKLFDYIGIEYDEKLLSKFSDVDVSGEMGDKTGIAEYKSLSAKSVNRWKCVINNPLRKMWCRRYLNWLGGERLAVMGYNIDELQSELNAVENKYGSVLMDILAMTYGFLYGLLELPLLKTQLRKLLRGEKPVAHC